MTWEKRWHCSVGYVLTGRDGTFCGRMGCAMPCNSQEDGWQKALAWLRKYMGNDAYSFLVHSFEIKVEYF